MPPSAAGGMNYTPIAVVCTLALVGSILAMMDFGRRVGVRRLARDGESALAGVAAIDGAVFALLGLLLAFTLSAAVYVIIDFEFPRLGAIRLDAFDYVLVDLRASMK